ncbi:MAG: BspA family leucine-rich repeat surface protein, partial [Promicromonosporaceae bacterium]|nr:BspA family leucine-rich repeat surface protein [Promicromonosporaceae bacterium]
MRVRKTLVGAGATVLVAALLATPTAYANTPDGETELMEGYADARISPAEVVEEIAEAATAVGYYVAASAALVAPEAIGIPVPASSVASGYFASAGGARWDLYLDGSIVVGGGTLNVPLQTSPWASYASQVTNITFTEPIAAGPLLTQLFAGLPNLTVINGLDYLDVSGATNMTSMFSQSSSLTSLDLSSWNTSNVTNMTRMFYRATGLTSLNVSGWDTGRVTNMSFMFFGVNGPSTIDVSAWNTGNVVNLAQMFNGASGLITLDVSGWNTGRVTNMTSLFEGTTGLTTLDVSNWNT